MLQFDLAGRWIKFPKDRGFAKQIVEILVSQRLNLIQLYRFTHCVYPLFMDIVYPTPPICKNENMRNRLNSFIQNGALFRPNVAKIKQLPINWVFPLIMQIGIGLAKMLVTKPQPTVGT